MWKANTVLVLVLIFAEPAPRASKEEGLVRHGQLVMSATLTQASPTPHWAGHDFGAALDLRRK